MVRLSLHTEALVLWLKLQIVRCRRLCLPSGRARLRQLKVEYAEHPIAIDVPRPMFSWEIEHHDRSIVQESFILAVWESGAQSRAKVRAEASNRSTFVSLPDGITLKSDTTYGWSVEGLKINATSSFSTGLFSKSDWTEALHGWQRRRSQRCLHDATAVPLQRSFARISHRPGAAHTSVYL